MLVSLYCLSLHATIGTQETGNFKYGAVFFRRSYNLVLTRHQLTVQCGIEAALGRSRVAVEATQQAEQSNHDLHGEGLDCGHVMPLARECEG